MSSLVSVRLNGDLLHEMKMNAHALHLSQTEYIRKAIELLNLKIIAEEREKKLKAASLKVRENSMRINAEFSEIEHDPNV